MRGNYVTAGSGSGSISQWDWPRGQTCDHTLTQAYGAQFVVIDDVDRLSNDAD